MLMMDEQIDLMIADIRRGNDNDRSYAVNT